MTRRGTTAVENANMREKRLHAGSAELRGSLGMISCQGTRLASRAATLVGGGGIVHATRRRLSASITTTDCQIWCLILRIRPRARNRDAREI